MKQLVNVINGKVLPLTFSGSNRGILDWVSSNIENLGLDITNIWSIRTELTTSNEIHIYQTLHEIGVFKIKDVEIIVTY